MQLPNFIATQFQEDIPSPTNGPSNIQKFNSDAIHTSQSNPTKFDTDTLLTTAATNANYPVKASPSGSTDLSFPLNTESASCEDASTYTDGEISSVLILDGIALDP